jgi:hypothetical protein
VASITPEAINLVWVEAKPSGLPPRALLIPVDLRPYVRVQLKGQPNGKNKWEKQSENAGSTPVARQFPPTAQSAAFNADYMVRNGGVPKALPVEGPDPTRPATRPAAVVPAAEKPNTEWDQAMKLLQKMLPVPAQKP